MNGMRYEEQLIALLSDAKLLMSSIEFEGVSIIPSISNNGCTGCVFETAGKANECAYKLACMSHLRKDRNSVVFIRKSEEL